MIDRPDYDVMVVLPADHWIVDEDGFRDTLKVAVERLAMGVFEIEQPLVTLGVRPTFPSTDYGYLRPDTMRGARSTASGPTRSSGSRRSRPTPAPAS